jgi:L-xylulokinase
MGRYVLGMDNGGTFIKAALFTLDGKELAVASRNTPITVPKPGYTERSMTEMWQANCDCVKEAIARAGVKSADIAGVAVCGHGKGLYPWGKDGRPAYNGIISTDNRAWKQVEGWKAHGSGGGNGSSVFDAQYPKLCQQLMACQPLPILAWMKEQNRAVYDNIRYAFSATDYIRFMLTGEAYNEATNISGTALMNVRDVSYDRGMLAAFGVEEAYDMLAPLCYSSDICGRITKEAATLTGLAEGTPVAGGMFDIDACAIAMAVTSPEQFCTITGTWSINEFMTTKPVTGTAVAMNSLYAIPGYYLLEDSSATGAGNLDWVIQNCLENEKAPEGVPLYQHLDGMVEKIPPDQCDVYFLPFLYGSNRHPLGKASFVGLTSFHNKGHLLRAVYEGVAYSAKHHIDKLLSVRTRPAAVRLAGGAANSKLWVHIFADVLNLPIETVTGVKELGALGCGMAAAVAGGIYKDYVEAAQAMVRINAPVYPDAALHAVYKDKFEKYEAVCTALDTVWSRFEV